MKMSQVSEKSTNVRACQNLQDPKKHLRPQRVNVSSSNSRNRRQFS